MISKSEILMGRDRDYSAEYTPEISNNIDRLVKAMNVIRLLYGSTMTIASGWRPSSFNATVRGAAGHSKHTIGLACDVHDPDGKVRDFVLSRLDLMQSVGLYFEDFRWTHGWVHFQLAPPASGKRIFIPYADTVKNPMTNAVAWDGKYDAGFDHDASIVS